MSYCLSEQEAFEIFVTTDQNLKHQQNLANYRLTIMILIHYLMYRHRHSETIQLG